MTNVRQFCRPSSVVALVVVCVAVGLTSPASAASSECAEWRMPLPWIIFYQSNGSNVFLHPDEDQAHGVRGKTEYFDGHRRQYGLFEGRISAKKLAITIHWNSGPVGDYQADISPQGRLQGFTSDVNNRSSSADFHADKMLDCAKWVAATPPAQQTQENPGPRNSPDSIGGHNKESQSGNTARSRWMDRYLHRQTGSGVQIYRGTSADAWKLNPQGPR